MNTAHATRASSAEQQAAVPGKRPALARHIQPVVLAGGSGTRLWPLSREHYPKQMVGLLTNDSLLESTVQRLDGFSGAFAIADEWILVCGENHRFMSAELVQRGGRAARIVLEPDPRNTAPALTIAALAATEGEQDPILAVMPADHAVTDNEAFQLALSKAAAYASDGAIVALGVIPHRAETGYGYIRVGVALGREGGYVLDRFVEKPHRELAEQYVRSEEYWWNSGIFVMRASVWLGAIKALRPDIFEACADAYRGGTSDAPFFRLDVTAFDRCPADSIDYAVMERLNEDARFPGVVVPLDAGWSDIGSWDAIWEIMPKDDEGNVARGRVVFEQSTDSLAHSEGRLIACIGLRGVVVIETADAVLVADKQYAQQVKAVVGRLKSEHGAEVSDHRKVHRPWGCYDSVDNGERFQVKRIIVNPGASLSLQMHYHRAEHWVVVRGTAKVTCGEKSFLLTENQSTFIPLGTTHRLENPGKTPLEIIEVQSGAYLGEDDIVRFEDRFGRV
ncbi:MAG: mannose-1-phosphate guanylyltransferase/mannose-6-phosphate isomerase [Burkholderiales bacterium]|nr:mannose-1-phosphate guanylyltransferase/mannose-6-phosphate isomerase [Burkholderiales bacterium]